MTNFLYSRRDTIELNSVPADINEDVLENISKALSLTGVNAVPNELHAFHQMKRSSDRVIVKFKCQKQKNYVIYECKNLG